MQVLNKVAGLSTDDMAQFRELLERTTLQSIIRLSSEVTERLTFLDVLKDVVYGEGAGSLRERSELHRILEPNCWIFGPQYHLATSDKAFRKVIARQRLDAGLEPVSEDVIGAVVGIDQDTRSVPGGAQGLSCERWSPSRAPDDRDQETDSENQL